jgi:hypothetical protein
MALDEHLMFKIFCIYVFLIGGLWFVLQSEVKDSNEAVNYWPLLLIAVIGAVPFWAIQGIVRSSQEDSRRLSAAQRARRR